MYEISDSSTSVLRRQNRDTVLRLIAHHAGVSRTKLSQQTGLTGAAVSRITRELIDTGLIIEGPPETNKGKPGRRNIRLELNKQGAFVLGVSLAANVRSVSIGDCSGEVIARQQIPFLNVNDPDKAIAQLVDAARHLMKRALPDRSRLMGCGVSVAGIVNPASGELIESEPLGWKDIPLGQELTSRLSLPVALGGRAVALLRAEMWNGPASGLDNVVLINNGIWLGGAILMDGRILHGQSNMVGQIAHMRVAGDNTPCSCGRTGCLNAVASGATILSRVGDQMTDPAFSDLEPGDQLRVLAESRGREHKVIEDAFCDAGRKMGHAIDNILSVLDPELVLLAGEAGRHPDYLAGITETLKALRPNEDSWPIEASMVTSDESAVSLGLESFVFSSALDIEQLRVA